VIAAERRESAPFERIRRDGASLLQSGGSCRFSAIGQSESRKDGASIKLGGRPLAAQPLKQFTVAAVGGDGKRPVPLFQRLEEQRLAAAVVGCGPGKPGEQRSGVIAITGIHER